MPSDSNGEEASELGAGAAVTYEGMWTTTARETPFTALATPPGPGGPTEVARVDHGRGRVTMTFSHPLSAAPGPDMRASVELRLPAAIAAEPVRFEDSATCRSGTTEEGPNTIVCFVVHLINKQMWEAWLVRDTVNNKDRVDVRAPGLIALPGVRATPGTELRQVTSFAND